MTDQPGHERPGDIMPHQDKIEELIEEHTSNNNEDFSSVKSYRVFATHEHVVIGEDVAALPLVIPADELIVYVGVICLEGFDDIGIASITVMGDTGSGVNIQLSSPALPSGDVPTDNDGVRFGRLAINPEGSGEVGQNATAPLPAAPSDSPISIAVYWGGTPEGATSGQALITIITVPLAPS